MPFVTSVFNVQTVTSSSVTLDGRTVQGKVKQTGGGVGRNIADALGKLQIRPCFISAVGDEQFASTVLDTIPHLSKKGIMKSKNATTGTCIVVCDRIGECLLVVGDMAVHDEITPTHVSNHATQIAESSLVVLDGNLPQATIEYVLRHSHQNHVPVWFEPTDFFRATKPFLNKAIPPPTFISPNLLEFRKIFEAIYPKTNIQESDVISECRQKGYLLAQVIENIIITLGSTGVMVIRKGKETEGFFTGGEKPKILEAKGPISHRVYKPVLLEEGEIVNVSGAGDCFASGFMAGMLKGESEERCVELGFRCSAASLRSSQTVPEKF